MKRKIIFTLTIIMILSIFSTSFGQLSDIGSSWAKESIDYLFERGIINGYGDGTYRPKEKITRAEFINLVNEARGFTQEKSINFSDVKQGQWFYKSIRIAAAANYISGYPDGTMKPNEAITREQAATVIARAFNISKSNKTVNTFKDDSQINNFSKDYVYALEQRGYLKGYPEGDFKPRGNITREETATLLHNTLKGEERKNITNIKYSNNKVEIIGSGQLDYNPGRIFDQDKSDYRLYFDFLNTDLSYNASTIKPTDSSSIIEVRFSQQEGFTRVTLVLTGPYEYDIDKGNSSIVITIKDGTPVQPEKPDEPSQPEEPNPTMPTIILDPGHGGSDPGAIYGKDYLEKDWTLDINKRIERIAKKQGFNVLTTRDDDIYLDPDTRTEIVRNSGAKYAISSHINAGGGLGSETIHSIFSDGKLANLILDELEEIGLNRRRAFSKENSEGKDWYFMHRLTGSVSTIIVEYGFIDNANDREFLSNPENREKCAQAVVKALCKMEGLTYK